MAKANLRLPFLKKYRDRHGKLRFYYRPTGVALPGKPGSHEFMIAYHAAHEGITGPELTVVKKTPRLRTDAGGSVDWLVTRYLESDAFRHPDEGGLALETQTARRRVLERFRADHGDKPHADIQAHHMQALVNQIKGTPHSKRNWLKHVAGMFIFAEDTGIRVDNPCRGFKRPKAPKSDGFHSWTDAEIAQYRAHWPLGTEQRLTIELIVESSARRGDATRLGPENMVDGRMEFKHRKNGVSVSFPVSDELQQAVDAMSRTNRTTFLRTQAGEPRSAKALGNTFREWCDKAGLPQRCSMHGLRKGCLRIMAEAGCNVLELQSRSGHLQLSELKKYIDQADKRFAADRAAEKVIAHKAVLKTRRKIAA
jgi:site-specific recombinase XerD